MAVRRIRTLSEVIRWVEENAFGFRRPVSFEVFDTLLMRRVGAGVIRRQVVHYVLGLCQNPDLRIEQVQAERVRAYALFLEESRSQGLDSECNIQDWYSLWLGSLNLPPEAVLHVIEYEYTLHVSTVDVHPFAVKVLSELKSKGHRIFYMTDSPMGVRYITRLLKEMNLIEFFEAGCVSADYKLLKSTGRLYDTLLTEYSISVPDLVHIGHDPAADGIASDKGARALLVEAPQRAYRQFDEKWYWKNESWFGEILRGLWMPNETQGDVFYDLGRSTVGLTYAVFCHRVLDSARRDGIKHLYFLAREGYLLKHAIDTIQGALNPNDRIETHYFLVSDLTTFHALAPELTLAHVEQALETAQTGTLLEVLAPFRLTDAETQQVETETRLNRDQVLTFMLAREVFEFLSRSSVLQQRVAELYQETYPKLERLLWKAQFFHHPRVGIVGAGFAGHLQSNLFQSFRMKREMPELVGYYFGIRESAQKRADTGNLYRGLISEFGDRNFCASALYDFPQLFSHAARAPHAKIIGYSELDGEIIPLLNEDGGLARREERKTDLILEALQRGVLEFVAVYSESLKSFQFDSSIALNLARFEISRTIRIPQLSLTEKIMGLAFTDDFGAHAFYHLSPSIQEGWIVERLKSLKVNLQKTHWRFGTVALVRNRLIQWIYLLQVLVRMHFGELHRTEPSLAQAEQTESRGAGQVFHDPFFNTLSLPPQKEAFFVASEKFRDVSPFELVGFRFIFFVSWIFAAIQMRSTPIWDGPPVLPYVLRWIYPLYVKVRDRL